MKRGILVEGVMMFAMIMLLASFVSSFAVGSKYWEEKPILASPGESVEFFVVLQNMAGEGGDVDVQGIFGEGADIVSFVEGAEYTVPFQTTKDVNMIVVVPEDAEIGEIMNIAVSFKVISGEGSDALGLGSSIERIIPVQVIEEATGEAAGEGMSMWIWLLIAVVIIAIVFWAYKKKSA